MKTPICKITLIAGALAVAPFAATADEEGKKGGDRRGPGGPGGPGRGRAPSEEMLKRYDTDGDGKISREEMRGAMEARRAEALAKFDADGDGELNEEERETARQAMILERFDEDGDGKLSKEEQAAADAARERMRGRGRPGGPGGPEGRRRPGGDREGGERGDREGRGRGERDGQKGEKKKDGGKKE